MTIINPKSNKGNVKFLIMIFTLLMVGGMFYIYQYNLSAEYKHKTEVLEDKIIQAKVENAELKNTFYKKVDPAELEKLAGELDLVLDKKPNYLNTNKWVSDSSF